MMQPDLGLAARSPQRYILKWEENNSPFGLSGLSDDPSTSANMAPTLLEQSVYREDSPQFNRWMLPKAAAC